MQTLFIGDLSHNNGPANVNKQLVINSNFYEWDTKNKNNIYKPFKLIGYLLKSKVLIFSGNYRRNYYIFRIAKILRKKCIYLMHSYSMFDSKINNITSKNTFKQEKVIFTKVDLILTVSELYKNLLLKEKPDLKNKIHYLNSGFDIDNYKNVIRNEEKDKSKVIVCGGNRIIKHNSIVSKAITQLNEEGFKCHLEIFGLNYDNNEVIKSNEFVKIHGCVPYDKLLKEMSSSNLFVVNSQYESFGLSVIDALMSGCNVLICKNAGINSIIKVNKSDIIDNYNDIEELKRKIKYNMLNNNNSRIVKSLDIDHYSWKNVSKRLELIADRIANNKDVKDIN